jgi:hypothetical protein
MSRNTGRKAGRKNSKKDKEHKPYKDTNNIVLTGRLTADPEEHGEVVTFGLAVHEVRTVEGDPVEIPFFIDQVVTFDGEADKCFEYLETGRQVEVVDSLSIGTYELKIDDEIVFYDEEEERPVMMKWVEVLALTVQFRR